MKRSTKLAALFMAMLLVGTSCSGGNEPVPENTTDTTPVVEDNGDDDIITVPYGSIPEPTTAVTEDTTAVEDTSEPVPIPKGMQVCSYGTGDEGVSTVCGVGYSVTRNNRQGIVIQMADDVVPAISIRWISGTSDAEGYASGKMYDALRQELGSDYISSGSVGRYVIAGKTLYGFTCTYIGDNDKEVTSRRLVESCGDSLIVYISEAYTSKAAECDPVYTQIIRYTKRGANYYKKTVVAEETIQDAFTISPSDVRAMRLGNYDDDNFRIQKPESWKLQTYGSYDSFTFRIYDPIVPDRQMYVSLKGDGLLKNSRAVDWYSAKYGQDYVYAMAPVLEENSGEYFYKIWNDYAGFAENFFPQTFKFPKMKDFKVLQSWSSDIYSEDIMRGTYKNAKGELCEGMFLAIPIEASTNPVDDIDSEYMVDIGTYNVYAIVFMTAPDGEFLEWADVFEEMFRSLEYSEDFLTKCYQKESSLDRSVLKTYAIDSKLPQEFSMAWGTRDKSLDLKARKASDSRQGLIRVYRTATGEVYLTKEGFLESKYATGYTAITDELYLARVAGYIEW